VWGVGRREQKKVDLQDIQSLRRVNSFVDFHMPPSSPLHPTPHTLHPASILASASCSGSIRIRLASRIQHRYSNE